MLRSRPQLARPHALRSLGAAARHALGAREALFLLRFSYFIFTSLLFRNFQFASLLFSYIYFTLSFPILPLSLTPIPIPIPFLPLPGFPRRSSSSTSYFPPLSSGAFPRSPTQWPAVTSPSPPPARPQRYSKHAQKRVIAKDYPAPCPHPRSLPLPLPPSIPGHKRDSNRLCRGRRRTSPCPSGHYDLLLHSRFIRFLHVVFSVSIYVFG